MATFRFRTVEIKGRVLRHGKPHHDIQVWRTHFPNVHGVSEIRGGIGGRLLEFPMLLFGGFTRRRDLEEYINEVLNFQLANENGTITHTGTGSASANTTEPDYEDCTLHGFEMHPMGPIFDYAGTVDGGWLCYGVLRFFQNSPK